MENALAVANYFVLKGLSEGRPITPMQAIKLVYISHGYYLALTDGQPLINEAVEAWKYGPVISSVYNAFRSYGRSVITKPCINDQYTMPTVSNETTKQFLDRIWSLYRDFDGLQLSALTHKEGTPWYETWSYANSNLFHDSTIPNDKIAQHYKELISKEPK